MSPAAAFLLRLDFLEEVVAASDEAAVEEGAVAVASLAAFLLFFDFLEEVAAVSEDAVEVLAESPVFFLRLFDFVLAVLLPELAEELESAD